MATIYHTATLTPGKLEVITAWLDTQSWGGSGEVTAIGSYRFDDPDGEVGIEGHLVSRDGIVLHVPLTYRSAPLDDPDAVLVGRSQHSVLGERWFYDATTDRVAIGCFVRALDGDQPQAVYELRDGDTLVGQREPSIVLSTAPASGQDSPVGCAQIPVPDGRELRVTRVLDADEPAGSQQLVATWKGGRATLAALGPAVQHG